MLCWLILGIFAQRLSCRAPHDEGWAKIPKFPISGVVMQEPLFRPEALRAYDERWMGQPARRVAMRVEWAVIVAVLLSVAALIWATNAPFLRRITIYGEIVPDLGMVDLIAPSSGVITAVKYQEDTLVNGGDIMFVLTPLHEPSQGLKSTDVAEALQRRIRQLAVDQAALAEIRAKQEALIDDRLRLTQKAIADVNDALTEIATQIRIGGQVLAIYEESAKKGLVSKLNLFEKEKDLSALREREAQLRADLQSRQRQVKEITNDRIDILQKLDERRVALDSEDSVTRSRFREAALLASGVVRAPRSGRITTLIAHEGQIVRENQPLARILPTGARLEARARVPNEAIGALQTGQKVALRLAPFPHQQFGMLETRLVWLSTTPVQHAAALMPDYSSAPVNGYEALIVLPDAFKSADGNTYAFKAGMRFSADVVIQQRSVLGALFAYDRT
jgi:membrane fusion protein